MSWIDCKFGEGYEIFTEYPFYIRKKKNGKIIKESVDGYGYVCVHLNRVLYKKHRIIAVHFIPNDEPLIKTEVDHINRDRTDYHLENLRWCSQKENLQNKSSNKGVDYEIIEYGDEEEDLTQVTDYGRHEFEQYLYYYSAERNRFLMDTGVNYRVLHINFDKRNGCAFVCARSKENKQVKIFFTKFNRVDGFD